MRLLCLADIHGKAAELQAAYPAAGAADVVVIAGDLTQLGGSREAAALLDPLFDGQVPLLAVAGNMDRAGVREYLAGKRVDLHGRGMVVDGVGFFGLGGGTRSPFGTPWELSDEEAEAALAAGFALVQDAAVKVLVAHAPPWDTPLDTVRAGLHAGSKPVRAFLEAHRVDACLSGHIHEGGGTTAEINGCLCTNVGPAKDGRWALVSVGDGPVTVTWRNR